MADTYCKLKAEGDIQWVTIDRQLDRNSINSDLITEIESVVDDLERESARAVVFTGAGQTHFIGGADGIEMMQLNPVEGKAFSLRFQAMLTRLERSPIITVAAINGLCFGGGFEFALACDLRVAINTARVGLPEVKVGLIPGGGGTQRLPRLVGTGLAMEMILSGKLYPGDEAASLGLVHRSVAPDRLIDGVDDLLKPILHQPQYALSLAKAAVTSSKSGTIEDGFIAEAGFFSRCHEHSYFHDLMVEQLKSGLLTTTSDKDQLINGDTK